MCVLVAQSCPTLCDPMDCNQPGSSVCGILQARVLEWVAISFSRGSFQPRDWTQVSSTAGRFVTVWAIREAQIYYTAAHVSLRYAYLWIKIYMPIVGLPCPLLSHEGCSNSCPLSQWYQPTISFSVTPFSCLQSFPASGSFAMSQLFASGCQKYWSFNFSISFSKDYSGLISYRIDWFDFLAVQGTLKSLLQHHSLKASILQHSAFFMVQLSHPYMTTGESIALTIQTFARKVMSLLFNMLCRFVIAFLPRSKCLDFMAAVTTCSDYGAQENKICFQFFPIYLSWSDGTGCHDLHFFACGVLSLLFHSGLSPSSRGSLVPLCFLSLGWLSSAYLHIHAWWKRNNLYGEMYSYWHIYS